MHTMNSIGKGKIQKSKMQVAPQLLNDNEQQRSLICISFALLQNWKSSQMMKNRLLTLLLNIKGKCIQRILSCTRNMLLSVQLITFGTKQYEVLLPCRMIPAGINGMFSRISCQKTTYRENADASDWRNFKSSNKLNKSDTAIFCKCWSNVY